MTEVLKLKELSADQVPADLRPATYFDFQSHPFEHQPFLEGQSSVCTAIQAISQYAEDWLGRRIAAGRSAARSLLNQASGNTHVLGQFEVLFEDNVVFEPSRIIGSLQPGVRHTIYLARGARVIGAEIYLDEGGTFIGEETSVEPCAGIKGPTVIGRKTEIRQGAYLRGDCIIGDGATIRGEIKNSLLMDKTAFPHPSYLGDSLCGYMTHFGNQATTANIGIYAGAVESGKRRPLVLQCGGKLYDVGKPKMGICMGDFSQVGCNSVSDPGTFLKPYTIVYPLTRISRGFYGPLEILKNKPLEHGIIERSPLRPM